MSASRPRSAPRRLARWACALTVLCALADVAHAAPTTEPKPSAKRVVSDYGGAPSHEPARGLLVVPKLVLAPPYLIWNYGIRKPLGALVSTAERNRWPTKILDFFTFGPDRRAGIVPTALFDFGIKPSVGVFVFWNKLGHPNNSATFHVGTWGPRWLNLTASDRFRLGNESSVAISGRWTQRPDMPFYGLGSRSLQQARTRYTSRIKQIAVAFDTTPTSSVEQALANEKADAPPARLLRVVTTAGVRVMDFAEGRGNEDDVDGPRAGNNYDMGLVRAIDEGRVQSPPGFPQGYTNVFERVDLQIDSRARRPANQSGVRLALEAELGTDVRRRSGGSWMRYGGSLGGFVDVGKNRTLGLVGTVLFADPLSDYVPFTEQVTFGGSSPMRGFLWNRLIGRSGAVLTLEYNWPVWVFMDGTVKAELGNVFDPHLQGLSARLLRMSALIGLRTSNTPNQSFEALVGAGSETFADGFAINSFRLVFGTSQF